MNNFDIHHITAVVMHAEPLIGAGLETALEGQPGINVARASTCRTGRVPRADVVLTDYRGGLELCDATRRGDSSWLPAHARVMIVTDMDREQEVRRALERGIHGYVLQRCALDELVQGVRVVARGATYVTKTVAQTMAESMTRQALTSREIDVLKLLAIGHCNKAIARELGISSSTVKSHVQSILSKLPATSRTEATRLAHQRGLLNVRPRAAIAAPETAHRQACHA